MAAPVSGDQSWKSGLGTIVGMIGGGVLFGLLAAHSWQLSSPAIAGCSFGGLLVGGVVGGWLGWCCRRNER
jgi:hypothetical protein